MSFINSSAFGGTLNKWAKEAEVMASKYGKESIKKINAAMGKEQIVQIGSRSLRVLDLLGEGGYAYVYKAEDMNTGEVFALKRMLDQDQENAGLVDFEIEIMKKLAEKPFVIHFLGSTKRRIEQPRATEHFVLMELCSGGSLMDMITRRNKRKFDEAQIASIFYQICVGVSHLHLMKQPIAHRDLKIENVLIAGDGQMRLCDFGSCTTRAQIYATREEMTLEEERIQKYSTSMYRAPEMVDLYKKELINEKVDIWALGCILYTLAFFTQPFQDGGNLQIIGGKYHIPETHPYSKTMMTLIKKQLTLSPTKRPDIKKVLLMIKKWIAELEAAGNTVVIPAVKKTTKKKKVESSSEDCSDSDSDSSDDEATKKTTKKAVKKPTVKAFESDFEADFGANSPQSSQGNQSMFPKNGFNQSSPPTNAFGAFQTAQPQSAQNSFNGFHGSQSPQFGAFQSAAPVTAPRPPQPTSAFDMDSFADSLIGGGPPKPQQTPSPLNTQQKPPTALSPRGQQTQSFDFFGGAPSGPSPSSSTPRGSRANPGVPGSAQSIAAALPIPKIAPKKVVKKVESSSDDSDSSDSDSDSDSDSSEDEAPKKRKPVAKKPVARR